MKKIELFGIYAPSQIKRTTMIEQTEMSQLLLKQIEKNDNSNC